MTAAVRHRIGGAARCNHGVGRLDTSRQRRGHYRSAPDARGYPSDHVEGACRRLVGRVVHSSLLAIRNRYGEKVY